MTTNHAKIPAVRIIRAVAGSFLFLFAASHPQGQGMFYEVAPDWPPLKLQNKKSKVKD
jgi:hypothetical protein